MSSSFVVQGWCPTAWQPMRAQDGWIVRVRPHCASINVAQWRVLAWLSKAHGDGQIELTRLGNVQLRGVIEADLPVLRAALVDAELVPAEADADFAPPLHCTPFYAHGDLTHQLALRLSQAVRQQLTPSALAPLGLSALPSKFGLLVDDEQQHLQNTGADICLWVLSDQRIALMAGESLAWSPFEQVDDAVNAAIDVAQWFAHERMQHQPAPTRLRSVEARFKGNARVLSAQDGMGNPAADFPNDGALIGVPLGRMDAAALLIALQDMQENAELRVTPWRSLWVTNEHRKHFEDSTHWITQADDARLRVSACTGAPRCDQAHVAAQELAMTLAPHVPEGSHVHVSGCAKFCALSSHTTVQISAGLHAEAVQLSLSGCGSNHERRIHITPDALRTTPQQIQQLIHDLHS